MRSLCPLPLLAMAPLLGCDATENWLRGPPAATAYATPLASDTTVVTTRRVWSWSRASGRPYPGINLDRSTIMPDGRGLITNDWLTGMEPVVFDLVTQEFTRFHRCDDPCHAVGWAPIPSPDGSKIALAWNDTQGAQLRVVDVTTGAARTLLSPDTAIIARLAPGAWTPAGDSVFAWVSPPGHLEGNVKVLLFPAAGGNPRLIHRIQRDPARMLTRSDSEWRMSLSPDGRWLLYTHELSSDQGGRSDIYIIDVQSGRARPLIEYPAIDLLVGWLPGTDIVLFSSDRSGTTDLWGVRVVDGRASTEPRLVRSGFFHSQAVGFADGTLFYRVTTGSRGPAVINVDQQTGSLVGAASPPLVDFESTAFWAVAWSPDGYSLAGLTRERWRSTVTLQSLQTRETRVFWLDKNLTGWRTQWAADGMTLFLRVSEGQFSTSPSFFLRLDPVTGTTTRMFAAADLGSPDLPFQVTPDGRSIVLRQRRVLGDGRTEVKIVLRSLKDGRERDLYRTFHVLHEFKVSPDGSQLAFVEQSENSSNTLFALEIDGSQTVRLIAEWDHAVSLLGWLPAGVALLAARLTVDAAGEEVLRVDLDGSTSVIREVRPFVYPGRSRLALSPAGNRIAQFAYESGQELWRMDGLPELFAEDTTVRR